MPTLDPGEVRRGTKLLLKRLEEIRDEDPEIGDMHDAFESYCMLKYSIGDQVTCSRTGSKGDCGIDSYSVNGATYHIIQCKIPTRDSLESNPEKIRRFGPSALTDLSDAHDFLLGESKVNVNDKVRRLYGLIESDKDRDDFSIAFYLIVFGRLNVRAQTAFDKLKSDYSKSGVRVILHQIHDIVDDFLVGSRPKAGKIEMDLRIAKGGVLGAHDYCYFLANAADLFTAFQIYGWSLFDLNLRYELRNSSVNGNIVKSLKYHKTRKRFHHYNNGLIVICQNYKFRDKGASIRITNAQVVNGLQTVKSIYNAVTTKEVKLEELERDCWIQVKVIQNEERKFVADVVRATNDQNPMAARNLMSNAREQKTLRRELASLQPRWFCQVKQGEWESLTQEGGRFFKTVVGHPPSEFRPEPNKKRGRILDNQVAAKAWLAFIGFSDYAGDSTNHYFAKDKVYNLAFKMRPTQDHWKNFVSFTNFKSKRADALEMKQGTAAEYLIAYLIWEFVLRFIPSPRQCRIDALDEGVRKGVILKSGGSFKSTSKDQDDFLAKNHTYQTWRLMTNMKEVLAECVAFVLAHRYGSIDEEISNSLLSCFDASSFMKTGEIRSVASKASLASDLASQYIFSRTMCFLHFVAGQYWEEKRGQIQSATRIRLLLFRPDMVADFKEKILEINGRSGLDTTWKPSGVTFFESLPDITA